MYNFGNPNQNISTVYLYNVSRQCSKEEVVKCCKVFGKVEKIRMHTNLEYPDTFSAFVRFQNHEQAMVAAARLNETRRFWKPWRSTLAQKELVGPVDVDGVGESTKGFIEGIVNEEMVQFLDKGWLLVAGEPFNWENFKELFEREGLKVDKLVKWGTFSAIVVFEDGVQVEEFEFKFEKLEKHFVKIEKLKQDLVYYKRFCWVECYGIPLQAWSFETMVNVANIWGNLLAFDVETDTMLRADVAKLFLETGELKKIDALKDFKFHDAYSKIQVKEFLSDSSLGCTKCSQSQLGGQSLKGKQYEKEGVVVEDPGDIGVEVEVDHRLDGKCQKSLGYRNELSDEWVFKGTSQNVDHREQNIDASEEEGDTGSSGAIGSRVLETPADQPKRKESRSEQYSQGVEQENCVCCEIFQRGRVLKKKGESVIVQGTNWS